MPSRAALELLIELKDQASSGLSSIGGALGSLGTIAGGVAVAGVAAFGAVLVSGIGDAREAAVIMAQTEQTIKTMGNAAGVSAQHVADFASSLSDASGQSLFGDDQIQAATNMLLTFGEIKGKTLDLATALSVDMAQALKSTPEAMSKLVGKTLNSADAMSALRKQGVSFTDEQIKLGKHLFETGHIAEYQALVMGELNNEFGGQAAAAAKAAGGMVQFKARLGEAAETMGTAALPLLDRMGAFLNDTLAPAVETAAAAFSAWLSDPTTIATIDAITNAITGGLSAALAYLSGTVFPAVAAVVQGQILPALGVLVFWFQGVLPQAIAFVNQNWESFRGALIAIGAILAGAAILGAIASLAATIATLASPIGLIIGAVALLGAAWAGNWGGIRDTLTAFWTTTAQPILSDLLAWLQVNIPVAIQALAAFWTGTLQPALATVWGFIQGSVIPILSEVWIWLATTIPPAIQTLAEFWTGTLQPALAAVWSFIQDNVIPILNVLVTVYIAVLKKELEILAGIWNTVLLPALNAVWAFLNSYVIPIISALVNVNIAILKKEVELLAGIWNNVLLPALKDVWGFIQASVIPVFENTGAQASDLAGAINNTLGPAFQWLGDNVLRPVVGFFNDIGEAVSGVIRWLNDLADTINSISIPDWAQGHSPPPLAQWFGNIADEVQRAGGAVDTFASTLRRAGGGGPDLGGLGGGGLGGWGDLGGGARTNNGGNLGGLGGLGLTAGGQGVGSATFHSGAIVINAPAGANARQIADIVVTEIDRKLRSRK